MVTVADKLELVRTTKSNIKTAIEAKGVTVGAVPFADYPAKIAEISGGGGGITVPDTWTQEYYEQVYDYALSKQWTRPTDWLAMPAISATDQKLNGLVAVYNSETNWIAFAATGAYTVDWGDGSAPEDFASGAVATHNYVWANVSSSTLTSKGYRQVILTITPQSGESLTNVNFAQRASGLQINYSNPWLDVQVAMNNTGTITMYDGSNASYKPKNMQRFRWLGTNTVTNFTHFFSNCYDLQVVEMHTGSGTTFTSMFEACRQLVVGPNINTSNATNITRMFWNCSALICVPEYNFSKVTTGTTVFASCRSLLTTPSFTFGNISSMNSFFSSCSSAALFGDIIFNHTSISKSIGADFICNGCGNLTVIPNFINTFTNGYVTFFSVGESFSNCSNLTIVENFRMGSSASATFSDCSKLKKISIITSQENIGNFGSVFSTCQSLEEFSISNANGLTVKFQPNAVSSFLGLNKLKSLELSYNTSTNNANAVTQNQSLSSLKLNNLVASISIANNALGPQALADVFTSLGTASAKTITITGNWGASLLTQEQRDIAINKGWTIVI